MGGVVRYVKEDGYYNDLYDWMTVEEGVRISEGFGGKMKESEEGMVMKLSFLLDYRLYYFKGERFCNREFVINEWKERDRKRDEKLNSVNAPEGIGCVDCQVEMKVNFKDLYDLDEKGLVLFIFECPKCGKRRGMFDDGKEYVSKGVKLSLAEKIEWERDDDLWEKRKIEEKEILKKYKVEFCLSDVEGEEYIRDSNRLNEYSQLIKEDEQKRTDPDYRQVMMLDKLTIVELELVLKGVLENELYFKVVFDKPIIDKHAIVPLSVQDGDVSRKEYDSVLCLKRVLKRVLEKTNWRLMSSGVDYRLGYLTCQLKGYEKEDDLVRIVKSK